MKKARQFFKPDLKINFYNGGGKNEMVRNFKHLVKNKYKVKTIFLFDCDAKSEFQDCDAIKTDNIIPIIIPYNKNNSKVLNGIENLFDKELFEDKFYKKEKKLKPDGGYHEHESLIKRDFSEFIRNEKNSKDDFINFLPILNEIEKFFSV